MAVADKSGPARRDGMPDRDSRIRVLFVSGEPDTPGNRYRVEDFASALPRGRYAVTCVRQDEIADRRTRLLGFDVVWLWRARNIGPVRRLIARSKMQGAAIVADIDDLVFASSEVTVADIDGFRAMGWHPSLAGPLFASRSAVLEAADLRTATTAPLVAAIETDIGPATPVPNGFDEDSWNLSELAHNLRAPSGLIRIGYAGGTLTHQRDLKVASHAIARVLLENPECRLVLFEGCVNLLEFPELMAHVDQIEWRPRVPISAMPFEYARFDVSLAPLEADNLFCEAKSALKFFEAALVHVASVASPTEPFREIVRQGTNGLLATTEGDWYSAITTLVKQPWTRARLAAQARRDVQWNCGPRRRGQMIAQVIARVTGHPGAQAAVARSWPIAMFDSDPGGLITIRVNHLRPVATGVSVVVRVTGGTSGLLRLLASVGDQDREDIDLLIVLDGSQLSMLQGLESWVDENSNKFARVRIGSVHGEYHEAQVVDAAFSAASCLYVAWLDQTHAPLMPGALCSAQDALSSSGEAQAALEVEGPREFAPQQTPRIFAAEAWAAMGGIVGRSTGNEGLWHAFGDSSLVYPQ